MKRVLKRRVRRWVVVTMKSGPTFRGVLFEHDDQCLVLRNVELLTPGAEATVVDGELVVFVADVDTIQLI